MAKNKNSAKKDFDVKVYKNDTSIINVPIADHNTEKMKLYGANVNLARMIPDIRDGLKPVERRIIYSMYEFSKAISKFKKVQTIIGLTMNIHPHGDSSIYNTIVRLAQPWENLLCPIDGYGNYGDIKGSPAGAARYIEAKLSNYALDCFYSDYDPKIMEMNPSYQPEILEPEYFVTKYPNMLMSISTGMGFSIATGIPTYNIEEILNATIDLIKNPKAKLNLIPDIPTGCLIIDEGQFDTITETGRGVFKMRGEIAMDEDKGVLVIKSIPFQSSLLRVKNKIKELVESKQIVGFKHMEDYSSTVIHLELFFKKDVDLRHIVQILYKKSGLQKSFPVQLKMVHDFEIKDYSVRTALLSWIDIRRLFKRKYFINKLVKAQDRKNFLDILIFILNKDNAEKTLKIIKKNNSDAIINALMKEYGISSLQARIISNMKMKEFSKNAYDAYKDEIKELPQKIKEYKKILQDNETIDKIIIEELKEGIKKYHAPRRSRVVTIEDKEEYANTDHILVFTKNGYVKKLLDGTEGIGEIGNGDEPTYVIKVNNKDNLIIFDKKGYVHTLDVGKIEPANSDTIGYLLSKYINVSGEVVSIIPKSKLNQDSSFLFITKQGIIKKTAVQNYAFKSSTMSIILNKTDELVSVINIIEDKDIVVYTEYGMGLRFNSSEINPTQRLAKGVIGVTMAENDKVIGISTISKSDKYLFLLTTSGNAKKCKLSLLTTKERRGNTIQLISIRGKERLFYATGATDKNHFNIILKNGIETIQMVDVPSKLKIDDGEKMIPVRKGDSILRVTKY